MKSSSINKRLKNILANLVDEQENQSLCHNQMSEGPMPSVERLEELVNTLREIVFPGYFDDTPIDNGRLDHYMGVYLDRVFEILHQQIFAGLCFSCGNEIKNDHDELRETSKQIALDFLETLPDIRRKLTLDVNASYEGDPAATCLGEVIFCYPSIRAIFNYRIAHALLKLKVPLIPRIISEMAHSETGIDIHPKATIGESFSIDHGTGVVIGATCIIGDVVKLYQGVTLGAKSFPLDDDGNPIKGIPRHPIIEDNVIVYAQATILGRIIVGKGSVIGGNVWVTENIAPNSKILQGK